MFVSKSLRYSGSLSWGVWVAVGLGDDGDDDDSERGDDGYDDGADDGDEVVVDDEDEDTD